MKNKRGIEIMSNSKQSNALVKKITLKASLVVYVFFFGVFFLGCSAKDENVNIRHVIDVHTPKAYEFKLQPQIGSRQDDARTVVDMGVVLKISVNSYQNSAKMLIGGGDMYIWAKRPSFIPTTNAPVRTEYSQLSPQKKLPFMLSTEEMDRSNIGDDSTIKEYVNEVYNMKTDRTRVKVKRDASAAYDAKIQEFLRSSRQDSVDATEENNVGEDVQIKKGFTIPVIDNTEVSVAK